MADEVNLGNEKNINLENPTRDITEEVRNNFLDYAISVIVARAIPDARDGFKPVHRRIIYAMLKLSMTHDKPHKKSARIVGEVLGKYHPHGDSSVYEAMVRMAQDFSYRYPLVDGHGNFGSIDGDRAAAMRYTESRMSKIAGELVRDLEKLIVPFKDNYDGSEKEPVYLPSYFPNLLINGSSGIAVAMATNIPPHNLNEVIDAICYAAKNPACDTLALLDFIKGPDFPTGAIILGQNAFKNAYLTGKSIVKVRSKTRTEKLKSGKTAIIIEEIPYQIKKSTLIEDIADKVQSKRVQYVTDLRDESNRDGIRIVIEIKNESFAQLVLNQLFKFTNLQCSFAINLVALDNNQPRLFDLKQLIEIYISHQITMITKKAKFELDNSRAKSHIIAGLLKALEKIDAVIALIRSSKNNQEAIEKLNENLALTTIQSKAILDMKLQRLTGLEKIKLTQELLELEKNITTLTTLLGSEEKKIENLIERLEDIKAKYGDERRTEILESYEDDLIDEALIKEEISVITLSKNGYIKRVPLDTYRSQNRGGVGVKAIANTENEDDYIDKIIVTSTHSDLLFFSDKGKVFRIRTHKVPIFSRTAKGFPIVNLIEKEKNEKIQSIISIDNYENSDELFFVTRNGTVKKSKLKDFRLIRNNGKIAIKLKGQNHLVEVLKISKNNEIIIAAANGRAVRFNEDKVRSMSRTATGVKGINVAGSYVIGACSSNNANVVLSISQKGYGKLTFFSEYRLSNRGTKGVISMKTNQKTGKLQLIKALDQNYEATELLIITLKGIMIRFAVSSMRTMSRNTSGIRLIRLKDNDDKIASSETLLDSQINTENVN